MNSLFFNKTVSIYGKLVLQSVLGIGKEIEVRHEKAADFVNPTLTRVLLIMMHGMIVATVSLCSRKWLLFFM